MARRRRDVITFREAAKRVHSGLVPTWRNRKAAASWLASVETYACPLIGDRPVETLTPADILAVLSPIWTKQAETGRRLRQRLAVIFDWAIAAGHYTGGNPVHGVKRALPVVKASANHYEALPWQEVPTFLPELRRHEGISARALEFLILTASRSGEVRGARWDEIEQGVWTVPANRMKRGIVHRVPLSPQAIAVLEMVRGLDPVLVFPSPKAGKPLSDMAFKSLFKRMQRDTLTAHGFRTSFRTWAAEHAHAAREVAEAALSHVTGNAVERAYARSDLLERRRPLMEHWGRFVHGIQGDVVPLPIRA